ncbi:MAG: WD40/YVTN/BNR-like repeat-containing protein [Treponema sp.]
MKKVILLFFIILLFFVSCNSQYSTDDTKENLFFSGACSNTINIMVGSSGQILKNTHGSLTWEKVKSHTDRHLIDAYYDAKNSHFYVAGHYGTVAFSNDGLTWQNINANPEYHLFGIATNENRIIATGKGLVVLSSKDGGNNWDKIHKGPPQLSFYDVAFGSGFWISVGDYGNILVLNDKTNDQTEHMLGRKYKLKSIAFNKINKLFVAVGHEGTIFTSKDNGTNWEKKNSETTEDLLSIASNGKRFVAVGTNGIVLTSKDGSLWKKYLINNNSTFRSISCTDMQWLAITLEGKKEIILDNSIE